MKNKNTQIDVPRKNTSDILKYTMIRIVQGLTAIAASDKKDLAISIGNILQRLLAGERLSILKAEWDKLIKKSFIKKDYQYTEQHKICLLELLDFLDKDIPDGVRFSVLKKIFLVAATEEKSDRDNILPLTFMRICRELSPEEILVLFSTYQLNKTEVLDDILRRHKTMDVNIWRNKIADRSKLKYPELVGMYEEKLFQKKLLKERVYPERSGVNIRHFGLTNLGLDICSYIEHYDAINNRGSSINNKGNGPD